MTTWETEINQMKEAEWLRSDKAHLWEAQSRTLLAWSQPPAAWKRWEKAAPWYLQTQRVMIYYLNWFTPEDSDPLWSHRAAPFLYRFDMKRFWNKPLDVLTSLAAVSEQLLSLCLEEDGYEIKRCSLCDSLDWTTWFESISCGVLPKSVKVGENYLWC